MSFMKLRRSMTQSEKHRQFVDKDSPYYNSLTTNAASQYRGAQIVECPQNVVELRKLLLACQHIERDRKKSISRINNEKQLMRKTYKRNLSAEELVKEGSTFDLAPGFRFKRNGDLKSSDSKTTTREKSVANIEKRLSSLFISRYKRTVSQEQLSPGGDAGTVARKLSRAEINREISQIEKELRELKTNSNIVNINNRIISVKDQLSHVKISVKSSDTKKEVSRLQKPEKPNLRPKSNETKKKKEFSTDRFSRKFSRMNCAACEARLKHSSTDISEKGRKTSSKPAVRWESAPSGVYVRKLDSHSQTSVHGRFKGRKPSDTTTANDMNKKIPPAFGGKKPEHKSIKALKTSGLNMEFTQSNPEVKIQESVAKVRLWQKNSLVHLPGRTASDGGNSGSSKLRHNRRSVSRRVSSSDATDHRNRSKPPTYENKNRAGRLLKRPTKDTSKQAKVQSTTTAVTKQDNDILDQPDDRYTEEQFRYMMSKSKITNKNNLATLDDLCRARGERDYTLLRKDSDVSTKSSKVDRTGDSRYSSSLFDFRKSLAQLEAERAISKIRMRNRPVRIF